MEYDSTGHLYGNFMQYEVARSCTATRLGIDNTPPPDVLQAAKYHAEHCLQPIRDEFNKPYAPQSWYRSEALERVLTKRSFKSWCDRHAMDQEDNKAWEAYYLLKSHPKGEATDIEIPGVSNDELFRWCERHLKFDQLIREFGRRGEPTSGWVHISSKSQGNRGQVFEIG